MGWNTDNMATEHKSSQADTKAVLEAPHDVPKWTGARHFLTLMLFMGMANAYVMRTNMSVAIVAMVNQSALEVDDNIDDDECGAMNEPSETYDKEEDGDFEWDQKTQSLILSAFFYGYVITQIPFGILAKRYGAKYFLGVGMLINSVFGLLVPWAANQGMYWLLVVRFIQGLGEGPIVPCTHAMLSNWVPPNERSRLGAFVYAGAQFGTVFSLPLSGLLSKFGFAGGWPSIFYVFGAVGAIWSLAFLLWVYEDPDVHPRISEQERDFINGSLWGTEPEVTPAVPWRKILTCVPFWAILIAHMGFNYGYETLLTQLPTFMKQVLHYKIQDNGIQSAVPYLCMWIFSMLVSVVADWLIWKKGVAVGTTRKLLNGIGMFGAAAALIAASFTGCSAALTVFMLSIGTGVLGATMSGYRINHLDISPRFAGVLMSITNCMANLFALLAPIVAGFIVDRRPTKAAWGNVFYVSAAVYIFCASFYTVFASGERVEWDNPRSRRSSVGSRRSSRAVSVTVVPSVVVVHVQEKKT